MKKNRTVRAALAVWMLVAGVISLLGGCSGNGNDSRNIVYEDMKHSTFFTMRKEGV